MKLDILKTLQELNFTEYEAKAYLALLEESPLTGYAVALNSGVPRSKIYQVLAELTERGEVFVSLETPALYTPLPPKELISLKKRKAEKSFHAAEEALERYSYTAQYRENIWNITGHEAIINRVKEAIKKASSRVLIEIWKEDAEELKEDFQAAALRGIEIIIVSYGDLSFDFAKVYSHDSSEQITSEYGGRWIIMSVDNKEIVAGIVSLDNDSRAAWTTHPALVMPITEVIIHDLYIMEMLQEHRDILEASFGPNLIELRKRFNSDSPWFSAAEKLGL